MGEETKGPATLKMNERDIERDTYRRQRDELVEMLHDSLALLDGSTTGLRAIALLAKIKQEDAK
jgi:hypothetical protein